MSVCKLQNLEKYGVLCTDFSASCGEINRFSVSKIASEPAKPTISLALVLICPDIEAHKGLHINLIGRDV